MVEIAKDGQYSVKESVKYRYGLGSEELNTFTSCFRVAVKFLRPEFTTILSYSSFLHDNTFLAAFNKNYNILNILFCKYHQGSLPKTVCSKKPMKSLRIHDQWHHFCWTFETTGINSDQIKVSTKLFHDGQEVNQGKMLLVRSSNNS